MTDNLDTIKQLLIKHEKTNFWGSLHFLIVSGYHELEAYDIVKQIHPTICNKNLFLAQSNDVDKIEIVILNKDTISPNILEIINHGIDKKLSFENFPVQMMEHYVINFKVPLVLGFLVDKLKGCEQIVYKSFRDVVTGEVIPGYDPPF